MLALVGHGSVPTNVHGLRSCMIRDHGEAAVAPFTRSRVSECPNVGTDPVRYQFATWSVMQKLSLVTGSVLLLLCACAAAQADSARRLLDLGIVPIGELPANLRIFKSTDCGNDPIFSDCFASDAQGREYVFFDGMLTRVSLRKSAARGTLRLPAGLRFGEPIDLAEDKAKKFFNIDMEGGKNADGRVSYASDFVIRQKSGTLVSLELIADDQHRLVEIVQRVDSP
jgi:hypothetical protein